MTDASDHSDTSAAEPGSTAYLLQEMQLFGYRPYEDEPDPRPLPDAHLAGGAIADMFDGLYANLGRAAGQDDPNCYAIIWNPVD